MRRTTAAAAQVKIDPGQEQLKGYIHSSALRVDADKGDSAFKILLVGTDRHVGVRGIIIHWIGKTRSGYGILGVFSDERRRVIARAVRNFDDFFGSEGAEVDPGNTGCVVGINKSPAAIVFAVCGGKGDVVTVVPGYKTVRSIKHGFCFLAIAPSIFRHLGEYRDDPEQATRRQSVNTDLTVETTGHNIVKLVVLSGCHIHFGGGVTLNGRRGVMRFAGWKQHR